MLSAATGLRRTPRVLLGWLAVPLITGAALLGWLLLETCENSRLRELPSPDRQWKLVVFERTCSGTVAWTTHVSAIPESDALPNSPGNLLVSFERHGSLVGKSIREPEVRARWQGARSVELEYSSAAPIQSAVSELGGLRIIHTRTP